MGQNGHLYDVPFFRLNYSVCFPRFSALLPFTSTSEFDALSKEFIAYQLTEDKPFQKKCGLKWLLPRRVSRHWYTAPQ